MKITKSKTSLACLACAGALAISISGSALATTATANYGGVMFEEDRATATYMDNCISVIMLSVFQIANGNQQDGVIDGFAGAYRPKSCTTAGNRVTCVAPDDSTGVFTCTAAANSGGLTNGRAIIVSPYLDGTISSGTIPTANGTSSAKEVTFKASASTLRTPYGSANASPMTWCVFSGTETSCLLGY